MSEPALLLAWERLTAELMTEGRRFPVGFRHNLVSYINDALLDGLTTLATLPYAQPHDKLTQLSALDAIVARLRVLVRQCYTQRALGERGYTRYQSQLNALGKMIGGWSKHLESRGQAE